MNVVRAETAGFCMGVSLALKKLDALTEEKSGARSIYMLGPIIHNPQVLQRYRSLGVHLAEHVDDVPDGALVIVRAHGIPRHREQELLDRGVEIVDATCPKVKKAQLLIGREAEEGQTLLLYGENEHPEVKGLLSYAPEKALVFESLEELRDMALPEDQTCFLAAQTTQDRNRFQDVEAYLKERVAPDMHVLRTICNATRRRQQEAIEISRKVDMVIVVGGRTSGNTRRLVKVVEAEGTPCVHVETVDELPLKTIESLDTVGLTAGASTPSDIIDEVEQRLLAL